MLILRVINKDTFQKFRVRIDLMLLERSLSKAAPKIWLKNSIFLQFKIA